MPCPLQSSEFNTFCTSLYRSQISTLYPNLDPLFILCRAKNKSQNLPLEYVQHFLLASVHLFKLLKIFMHFLKRSVSACEVILLVWCSKSAGFNGKLIFKSTAMVQEPWRIPCYITPLIQVLEFESGESVHVIFKTSPRCILSSIKTRF